jgi:hypothetical protein
MKQVRVVSDRSVTDFQHAVNEAVKEGWALHYESFRVEVNGGYFLLLSKDVES